MSAHVNQDVLRSTLDELRHLWVDRSCLTSLDRSQVADGGYGRVFMEEMRLPSQPPRKVAVKQLWSVGVPDRLALRFARELKFWANLKHDNVLELLGYYLSDDYTTARLISPFMVNGNVTQYISNANPTTTARLNLIRGMTRGMIYLHSLSPPICHGDLKPGNVLVTDTLDAVLCDFGLASLIQDSDIRSGFTTSRSIKGSLRYMSPELLLENEPKHSLASDVWAWACTAFEMIADTYPYAKCKSDTSIIKSMLESGSPVADDRLQLEFSRWEVDTAAGPFLLSLPQVLRNCWDFDSTKRPLLSDVWPEVKTSKGDDKAFPGELAEMNQSLPDSTRSSGGSGSSSSKSPTSTRPSGSRNPGGPRGGVESTMTRLLVATKLLLASLTSWSNRKISEQDVSDVYVRFGDDFNACVVAFAFFGIEMWDLRSVPEDLRNVLETCLAEDPTPETLELFLPQVREIIWDLLHGLRRKQSQFRATTKERGQLLSEGQTSTSTAASGRQPKGRRGAKPRPQPAPQTPKEEPAYPLPQPLPSDQIPAAVQAPPPQAVASAVPRKMSLRRANRFESAPHAQTSGSSAATNLRESSVSASAIANTGDLVELAAKQAQQRRKFDPSPGWEY